MLWQALVASSSVISYVVTLMLIKNIIRWLLKPSKKGDRIDVRKDQN